MASVVALLDAKAFKPHAKIAALGAVLPIASYLTSETSFATDLSHGGALYLVVERDDAVWLVAALEAPECAGIRTGDTRKPGWYAATNATPVTDLSKLRRKLGLGGDLEDTLEIPKVLKPAQDAALRELLDAVDAPVLVEAAGPAAAPVLDAALPPLERAVRYLAGSHLHAAIGAINQAWSKTRSPALADLVDRITRLTPEYHRPLFDRRVGMFTDDVADRVWDAAFEADPVTAMPQLLLNLAAGNAINISTRARALAKLPEDCRLGARLIELVTSAPNFAPRNYWPPIFDIWLRAKDIRTFASIEELLTGMIEAPRNARLRAMIDDRSAPPDLSEADAIQVAVIERELERLEEPLRTERALVDEIAANPDDDGPYLVYADWLIERGRPLGELISLSCQQQHGNLTAAQARRLQMLIEVPYLCGAFDDVPTSRIRKRQRGIDRELAITGSVTPRSWLQFAATPLVRALRTIRMVGVIREGREAALAELIAAAPALERIENLGASVAGKVAKRCTQQVAVEGDDLVLRAAGKRARRA